MNIIFRPSDVYLDQSVKTTSDVVFSTARIGPAGANSIQPLEIVGTDGGIAITSTNTLAGTEAYKAGFIKDSGGTFRKVGADAFQWTDSDATSGYASWNVHTTKLVAGVASDVFALAVWAGRGAAFFPTDLTSSSAPGSGFLKINGQVIASVDGGNTFSPVLAVRNTNAGDAASTQLKLGNNASAGSATFISYSSNHATTPNYATLFNEFNAPLLLGVNGDEKARITNTGFSVTGKFGVNGAGEIAKPAVTGSRGSNAALASLLTALASYGLITDSSS
jgi:hypothetical protein